LFRSVQGLLPLAVVLLMGYISQQVLMNVYVLYSDYRFGWTDRTVGLSLAVVGICQVLYGVFVVKRVVAKFGEQRAMIFGFLGGALGYCCIGSSKTGLWVWLGIPLLNLMSLAWPAAQSLMSRSTPPSEQGQLQGGINSLRGISGLVGPGLFTWVFAKSIGANAWLPAPGSAFFVAAGLLLVALVVVLGRGREVRAA
jgi:DHA1 family tetracycline resistance protein-like MFS transporter